MNPSTNADTVAVPPPSAKALRYYRSGNLLWFVDLAWGLAMPMLWLWTGASVRLRDFSWRVGQRWFVALAIYAALYLAISALLEFPFTYYVSYVRPHSYGLSHQGFPKWFGDALKRLGVGMLLIALLLWIPYGLMARSPRHWWIYTSLMAVPVLVSLVLVMPIWFDPLFNRFGPMHDQALEAKILALADRAGIEGGRVYEVDKGRDTSTVNAYVTGLFGTKRIVLWDTLLAKLSPDEVLCVMGHEMGHFALGHVLIGLLLSCLGNLVGLGFIHWTVTRLLRWDWLRTRTGLDRLADVATLPLLLLVGKVFVLATLPIGLAISRHQEFEADRFALEITRNNHACASTFVKLQLNNLSHPRPGPFYKLWRASHPSLGDRIDFSNTYRPWTTGDEGRYERYFRSKGVGPNDEANSDHASNGPP
ncbi:MAG: M48 family metallopeptidase [Isosphaeraceae bacterium]